MPFDMRQASDYASKCSLLYNFSRENDSLNTAGTPVVHDITDLSRSAAANNGTPVGTSDANRVADAPGTK